MTEKRVGFFLSKWIIHQQAVDSVDYFVNTGYVVDIFLYGVSDIYGVSGVFQHLKKSGKINIYEFGNSNVKLVLPWLNDSYMMFEDTYKEILEAANIEIVIFGTGGAASQLVQNFPISVDYFVDNDESKWEGMFCNKTIASPNFLYKEHKQSNVKIVVASMYYGEIAQQLTTIGYRENVDFFNGTVILDQFLFKNVVLTESEKILKPKTYKALIGIEKIGMIWAGMLAEKFNIPFAYHSLELYTSDHPAWSDDKYNALRNIEKRYHQLANFTIIQDEFRAKILSEENEIYKNEYVYVPISLYDSSVKFFPNYVYDKYNIDVTKKIILFLTLIAPQRFCYELVSYVNQNVFSEYQFIIHGPCYDNDYLERLNQANSNNQVILSTEILDINQLDELVASAFIGLVFFQKYPLNDQLTVFSAEKIARYFRMSKPIITFDYLCYRAFIDNAQSGRYISSFEELYENIKKISTKYKYYANNARKSFVEYYDFFENYKQVVHKIESI